MSATEIRVVGLKTTVIVTLLFLCGAGVLTAGTGWREVLDRADRLIASGEPDSADVLINDILTGLPAGNAESQSGSTVRLYRNGVAREAYFKSFAEAELVLTQVLRIRTGTASADSLSLAMALSDLAGLLEQRLRLREAGPLYRRALRIQESAGVGGTVDAAISLRGIAGVCLHDADYSCADSLCRRSLLILEGELGEADPEIAWNLDLLAEIALANGDLEEAGRLAGRSLEIRERALGPDHGDIEESLFLLARVCYFQNRYAEADSLLTGLLTVRDVGAGQDSLHLSSVLLQLATVTRMRGDYPEAASLCERSVRIREAELGPDHELTANSLHDLGKIYVTVTRLGDAEEVFERALDIYTGIYGYGHPTVGIILYSLSIVYMNDGRYDLAKESMDQTVDVLTRTLGPDHWRLGYTQLSLAAFYWNRGKLAEAEAHYRQGLAVFQSHFGPDDAVIAQSLRLLGAVLIGQGRYADGVSFLKQGIAMFERVLGPEHKHLGAAIGTLADFYQDQGRYAEAESLHVRALAIFEKAFGPGNAYSAGEMNSLADIYIDLGRYAEAETMLRETLATMEEIHGPESHFAVWQMRDLGRACIKRGNYEEAGQLLSRAQSIYEKSYGPNFSGIADCLELMCRLRRLEDEDLEATRLAERACRIREKNFEENSRVLSERDALAYARSLRSAVNEYLTCVSDVREAGLDVPSSTGNIVLLSKGQVSDGIFERQRQLVEESDPTTLALAEQLRLTKFNLSQLYVEGPGEDIGVYKAEVDSIGRLARGLEVDLAHISSSFREYRDSRDISIERVASLLPERTSLVEYVRYDYLELEPERAVAHYLVTVQSPAGGQVLVDLGEASGIDGLVESLRAHMLRVASSGQTPNIIDQQEYNRLNEDLYDRIWSPIGQHVDDVDLAIVAPDGALNMVSFAGLRTPDGEYLVEKHAVHYLSAGRDVVRLEHEPRQRLGLLAFGDPDYGAGAKSRLAAVSSSPDSVFQVAFATRNIRSSCGRLHEIEVTPLPGTRHEVELISASWEASTFEPLVACYGIEASEERFKADAPGMRVIHLATHGYFLGGECRQQETDADAAADAIYSGENPLLLSGLFLAGANLHGEGAESVGADDGILTAYEVSAMCLEGTELVVLSACETGLGEVAEGEGVYGLRRAFQMAGARTVVSALWPVSDEATADMLGQLYGRSDESLPVAMRRIQLERIEELRSLGRVDHPFTWGAFVAVGDWR